MENLTLRKIIRGTYAETLTALPEALKSEGFGILTEIDVQDIMKRKLNVEFRPYKIFGACNPPLAHQALSVAHEIGVMLPCNVIVYVGDRGETVVAAIDPAQTIASRDPRLAEIAHVVRDKLSRVLARLDGAA
jgi:uncharacterized protein (DUF302 family)